MDNDRRLPSSKAGNPLIHSVYKINILLAFIGRADHF